MQPQESNTGETRILALDTSGRSGTLALAVGSGSQFEIVETVELPASQRTAQSMLPELDALLKRVKWRPSELGLVTVTSGPGSFTGLRIGLTAAKTIAYATKASLVGVHTLLAIAEQVPEREGAPVWTILDAQRQELFAALHHPGWRTQSDYRCETQLLDSQQWLEMLRSGEIVSGPPMKSLSIDVPDGVTVADESLWSPAATSVARLGYSLYCRAETIDPMQLVPDYYRKSAAEEKAESTGNP